MGDKFQFIIDRVLCAAIQNESSSAAGICASPAYDGIPLGHLPGSKGQAGGDDSRQSLRNGSHCQRYGNLEVVQGSLQLHEHDTYQRRAPRSESHECHRAVRASHATVKDMTTHEAAVILIQGWYKAGTAASDIGYVPAAAQSYTHQGKQGKSGQYFSSGHPLLL